MVGVGGAVRRTLDAGATWTRIMTTPVLPDLETIQVFNSNELLVTGVDGFIARSSDGGLNKPLIFYGVTLDRDDPYLKHNLDRLEKRFKERKWGFRGIC